VLCLASASPRRRELLQQLGVAHTVAAAAIDESLLPGETPRDYVLRLAAAKAAAVMAGDRHDGLPVLGADTAVVVGAEILGKPADAAAARVMLRLLSGREHQVLSAVALARPGWRKSALSATRVRFRLLSDADITAYVATGEPFGKAGGYAIQGRAAVFIAHIDGSYSGVMGLPLFETATLLAEAGILVCP
jgi:septum formation protein